MRYLFLLWAIALLSACQTSVKPADETNNVTTDSQIVVNSNSTEPSQQSDQHGEPFETLMKNFLTPEQTKAFNDAKNLYNKISTAAEMAQFYVKIVPELQKYVQEGMQKSDPDVTMAGESGPAERWKNIHLFLPCFESVLLCSECSSEAILNIVPLIEKAKNTPENFDDLYFDALKLMYNTEPEEKATIYDGGGNIATWFTMDGCDFCSYSNLGDGTVLNILQALDNAGAVSELFKEKIEQKRGMIMPHEYQKNYGYSKEEVEKELKQILQSVKLTSEEKTNVEKALKSLKSKVVQFNCKKGGCTYDA
jgi:hypothetical protein